MPTRAEQLTPASSKDETSGAVGECISQMKQEHPDWKNEQCVAACYSMAEKSTGRASTSKSTTIQGI